MDWLKKNPVKVAVLIAILVNAVLGYLFGLARPMESDAFYYMHLAQSLAQGHGFVLKEGFWPEAPAMGRAPGWPAAVAVALKVAGPVQPDLVMRVLNLLLNCAVAGLVALLAARLFGSPLLSLVAGVAYALHPTALYLACTGESEILFLFLAIAGVVLMLNGPWQRFAGFVLLGLATLVRTNFLAFPVFFLLVWFVGRYRGVAGQGGQPDRPAARQDSFLDVALGILLLLAPSLLWALRNYEVSGHFPVLNTVRGQTFYGGNNAVVAGNWKYWGYWVFPDSIPGETPMRKLAESMSEYDVDRHYFAKGVAYVRSHLTAMPLLWLGKAVRAYLPVPWTRSAGTLAVSVFRWAMYAAGVYGIFLLWKNTDLRYKTVLLAMVLANAATVLAFWGCARFAFEVEPFLLPFAAGGVVGWIKNQY